MTDEELIAIQKRMLSSRGSLYLAEDVIAVAGQRIEVLPSSGPLFDANPREDIETLLAEVQRLRLQVDFFTSNGFFSQSGLDAYRAERARYPGRSIPVDPEPPSSED